MAPLQHAIAVNGITLTWFEWPGSAVGSEPPMVFAHATGFHARVFDAVIEHFPNRRVIAIDLRGHGRSTGGEIAHWNEVAHDIDGLIDHLGIRGAVGIGHSMGAHNLLQAAHDRPAAFSQLVLFDPVILDPDDYAREFTAFGPENRHPTARRKRDFASAEDMIARFESRDPYDVFDRRVFEDYCRYGLLPAANGKGFELACSPKVEASVYETSRTNAAILDIAREVDIPVLVVRARHTSHFDFKSSPTWPQLASIMPQGTDLYRPDMTHFHPFQDPADAARIIAAARAG